MSTVRERITWVKDDIETVASSSGKAHKYDDAQPRDNSGRWTAGGGGESTTATEALRTAAPKLTDQQKSAVSQYTSQGDYVILNEALRGIDGATVEPWMKDTFKQLDSAIASSTLEKPMTLYRGLDTASQPNSDLPDGWLVGSVVKDPGYVSTSSDEKTAYEFTNNAVGGNGWVMKMEAPSGSHALEITGDLNPDIAEYGTQNEWLLPRDSQFEITAKDDNAHTVTVKLR